MLERAKQLPENMKTEMLILDFDSGKPERRT